MEVIGIKGQIKRIELVEYIHSLFPNKKIINWQGNFSKTFIYDGIKNTEDDVLDENFQGFAVQIEESKDEFKTILTLLRTDETYSEERELFLALKLSNKFNCSTIINIPSMLSTDPYLNLVVEKGNIYEADDEDSDWGDGTELGRKVKIIKQIEIDVFDFDRNGDIIKTND